MRHHAGALPATGEAGEPGSRIRGGSAATEGDLAIYAWEQARLGDAAARADIIVGHRALVARLVAHMGIPPSAVQEREDLVSAGVIGLIGAVDRYDPARGVPFEAFARTRVRGAVIDELRRLDGRGRVFWKRVRAGEPVAAPSADALSLDRLAEAGTEPSISDASDSLLERDLWNDVGDAVEALPERERDVIRLYYGASRTLREIGTELGVSEARICQLHARAIARLRRVLLKPREPSFSLAPA